MITIRVDGMDQVLSFVEKLSSLQLDPMLTLIGNTVRNQTVRRIQYEKTDPLGGGWAPLAPSTVKGKGNGNILVDTGTLSGSIGFQVSGNSVSVGTNVFYGKYHQGGTSKMPMRRFLGLSPTNMTDIERVIRAYLETLL
jgi:phage virion morphogenesis protein